jgi:hypothetical protein
MDVRVVMIMSHTKSRPRPYRAWPSGVVALGIIAVYVVPLLLVWLLLRVF